MDTLIDLRTDEFLEYTSSLARIDRLEETLTPRLLREATLGDEAAIAKVKKVEDDIAELRVESKKLYDNIPTVSREDWEAHVAAQEKAQEDAFKKLLDEEAAKRKKQADDNEKEMQKLNDEAKKRFEKLRKEAEKKAKEANQKMEEKARKLLQQKVEEIAAREVREAERKKEIKELRDMLTSLQDQFNKLSRA